MRVLLTGGYGCIGSWIVKRLLERNDSVFIYDLKQDLRRLKMLLDEDQLAQVQFLQGDVTDLTHLRTCLEKHGITHVVHLAGLQVPVCRADPLLGAKVNVLGTLTVFEAVKAMGAQIQRLVYASSAAVLGPPSDYPPGTLPNDIKLTPATHYGYYKVCNEGNARVYYLDHGLSSIGLRPWTVYGVGRDFGMTSEPTKAIKSLALGRSYRISFGGWQDMQYTDDVALTFIHCLDAAYQGAKAYHLRGHVVDLATFHRTLCEVEPDAAHKIAYGDRQLAIAYDLDDSELQRDLGPIAKTPLIDDKRETLDRLRQLQAQNRLETYDLN